MALLDQSFLEFSSAPGTRINMFEADLSFLGNLLDWFSRRVDEDRAQTGMAINERLECLPQCLNIQSGCDPDRARDVVGSALGRHLMQDPEGALTIRKGVGGGLAWPATAHEWGCAVYFFLKVSDSQAVKKVRTRDLNTETYLDAVAKLYSRK
jgi:hypothetical protein